MKIFTVHLLDASETRSDPEFVPETFSFGAFFGLFFWTAYHRCWRASLGIILFEEMLLPFHYYGGALVFAGVYIARKIKTI